MPWLRSHRSASFLKSSLSSMKRTHVMSAEKEGEMRILCKALRTIHRTLKTGVAVRNAQGRRPSPASLGSARGSRRVPRDLLTQSSVNVSQAMLSQAMLSQAMLSHATLSHTTLSHATLSHTTLSQAKLSQATLFQTRVSQVSSDQKMPPNSGSFHCSGEPKRTGYSARAKPSAGRSPRLAQATGVGLESVPTRNPPRS